MQSHFNLNSPQHRCVVHQGDCKTLIEQLPDNAIDIVVTSPPYWGQRISEDIGTETDPRTYIESLMSVFNAVYPKLKSTGIVWLNMGDSYNTGINWDEDTSRKYSSLGHSHEGCDAANSAYTKPRFRRRPFIEVGVNWLTYGNLLMLPERLVLALTDDKWLYRGEVLWVKKNPMPEGICRRPHRKHEGIFLLAKSEKHQFRTKPPVSSVWEFANERIQGLQHRSRFPTELPKRCIEAYGISGPDVVVLDPFSGSGSTGIAAAELDCRFIGFEIDTDQVNASQERISAVTLRRG